MTGPAVSSNTGATSWVASRNAPRDGNELHRKGESMNPNELTGEKLTFTITEEIHVRASLEATFAALLEQIGPHNELQAGKPLPMKIEAWPGGRWYRDLGNDNGHFWGHVQVIKRPTLLEISGPLMMSYPT